MKTAFYIDWECDMLLNGMTHTFSGTTRVMAHTLQDAKAHWLNTNRDTAYRMVGASSWAH